MKPENTYKVSYKYEGYLDRRIAEETSKGSVLLYKRKYGGKYVAMFEKID